MNGIYQRSTPSTQTKAPKPSNFSSKRTKKPHRTNQLSGKKGIEAQEKCKTPGDNYTSMLPRPIISHSQSPSGTINFSTSTKEILPKSGKNTLMGPPSTIWQTSNKLAAAIDVVVETMYGTNLSLTPPTPSMKATSDNDTVEEAQFAEYYYDGETQPFSFSPEQLLATTDTNVRPTPSNQSLRSNPETLPNTQEKNIIYAPEKPKNKK